MGIFSADSQLSAAKSTLEHLSKELNLKLTVRLWNGELIPLGTNPSNGLVLSISEPGVVGSLLRRPTPENLVRLYATGKIDFEGGNLIEFREAMRMEGSSRQRIKGLRKSLLARNLLPFLFARTEPPQIKNEFDQDEVGRTESKRNNKDYIQFHYDVGNEFYKLFLDKEMQYSCGYFHSPEDTLEQAQLNKLEMICRKLRLKPGERMLDIGCGWGGLICYAAKNFGVKAHGITLSQQQHDLVQQKIRDRGLVGQVSVELCDYEKHQGQYDKISSIGMFEHIGVANYPTYFRKVRSMLCDHGILLNHAIARSAKKSKKKARYIRPERRLLLKYIFPGSELTSVGFTSDAMEHDGFEVHDVEAWRVHYGMTCKAWCERLTANRDEAIRLVGHERYRLWVAYLAGASCGFVDGGIKIYQVVASKKARSGEGQIPLTREDLYAPTGDAVQKAA